MAIALQRCGDCGTTAYPAAERCRTCLSEALHVIAVDDAGHIISFTYGHVSFDPALQGRLPLLIGLVKLAAGPVVIAFLPEAVAQIGASCRVRWRQDEPGTLEALAHGVTPVGS